MSLQDYDNPASLGSRLRRRRLQVFLDMIDTVHRRKGACRVIDLGGRANYWGSVPQSFFRERNCTITLSNLEALSPVPSEAADIFNAVTEDACALAAPDRAYDLLHSNSVIEHVGDWSRMKRFAHHAARVADGYFVQTPDYWFPYEPHFGTPFFAQLPRPLQVRLLMSRPCGFFPRASSLEQAVQSLESCQLLTKRMVGELFPDAELRRERILGLSKSIIALRQPA